MPSTAPFARCSPFSSLNRQAANFGHVFAVRGYVLLVLMQFAVEQLRCLTGYLAHPQHAPNHVRCELEPVQLVEHRHVEWGCSRAFLLITSHVEVVMIVTAVRQAVNQPRIAMIGENDALVLGKKSVEGVVVQAVRMFACGLACPEIHFRVVELAYSSPRKEAESFKRDLLRQVPAQRGL